MSILGLDIGGANIKAANSEGHAVSRPFAIWKHPEKLGDELISVQRQFGTPSTIAVTMTAELADCFATKSEGVRFILDQVEASATTAAVRVWTTGARFVAPDVAMENPMQVAAANWHALATWIGREGMAVKSGVRHFGISELAETRLPVAGESAGSANSEIPKCLTPAPENPPSILIDIGTTTADFIPIIEGLPATKGLTDIGRLQSGELCYSGVKRTPLCAIAHSVPFRDGYCALAAELFATTLDTYLLLGDFPENDQDCETANGKPATIEFAHDRLARSICGDRTEVTLEEATSIARFVADVQRQRLAGALLRVTQSMSHPCQSVVISGSGSFLARRLVLENRHLSGATIQSLDEQLTPEIAEAACAFAVARLAESLPN